MGVNVLLGTILSELLCFLALPVELDDADETLKCDHSIDHSTEGWLSSWDNPVILFLVLYMVDLNFESVDEKLKCDHSDESY